MEKGDSTEALGLWDEAIELILKGFNFQTRSKSIGKSAQLHLQAENIDVAEHLLQLLDFNRCV